MAAIRIHDDHRFRDLLRNRLPRTSLLQGRFSVSSLLLVASIIAVLLGLQRILRDEHPPMEALHPAVYAMLNRVGGRMKVGQEVMVDLSRTSVRDRDLAVLSHVSSPLIIDLSETGISDAGLSHLKHASRVVQLDISNTSTTEAGMSELRRIHPRVNVCVFIQLWD